MAATTSTVQRKTPDITLYTGQTPNGIKISMALEELGLPYKTVAIDISKNTQKEPWFLAINPNGRIPALTDSFPNPDGTTSTIRLFESGSILQYLTDQYDPTHTLHYPRTTREHYEVTSWVFFQNAGLGPMQGQLNHFARYAPEKIPYAITRYLNETRRLYGVLEAQLEKSGSGWLVGDRLTIADLTTVGWVWSAGWAGVDVEEFPRLKEWEERVEGREACLRGRMVPSGKYRKYRVEEGEEIERKAKEASAWILRGMEEDAKKK